MMQMQINENNEVVSLRKVNKRLKYLFMILCVLAIIPLVLTIVGFSFTQVYAQRKSNTQKTIIQKTQILTGLQKQLQEQNYIYEFENMSISQFTLSFEHNNSASYPVKTILLQHNQLQQFSQNSIPGVQTLILDNNPLHSFSSNYFPDLNNFSIMTGALKYFSNNRLIGIVEMKSNEKIHNFVNNSISLKQLILGRRNTEVFKGNQLKELTSLKLSGNHSLQLSDNYLPKINSFNLEQYKNLNKTQFIMHNNTFGNMTQFLFSALTIDNSWTITNNKFSQLKSFQFLNNLAINQISENDFPQLTQLMILAANNIDQLLPFNITNNSMPKLKKITVNNLANLKQFSGNDLSSIQTLDLSMNTIISIEQNIFVELINANFSNNPIVKFQLHAPKLKTLDISNNIFYVSNNIVCPQLQTLIIENNSQNSFKLSQVESLKVIKAKNGQLKNISVQNGLNIKYVDLSNNKLQIFDQNWPKLQIIDVSSNILSNLSIKQHVNLIYLNAQNNFISQISLGTLVNLTTLHLSSNRLIQFTETNYQNIASLETLQLQNNQINKINMNALALTKLNIGNNSIKSLTLNTPNLVELDISQNQITQLRGLLLPNLQLFITDNPLQIFSDNQISLNSTDTMMFGGLSQFKNNSIDGHTLDFQQVSLIMNSAQLHHFQLNNVKFNSIEFTKTTVCLLQILHNQFTARSSNIQIRSPYLQSFVNNTINFCNQFSIMNTSLSIFENNTLSNVSHFVIVNSKLESIKNNHIYKLNNMTLDHNLLNDDVIDDIIGYKIQGLEVISLQNNSRIINKTQGFNKLKKVYPNAIVYL